MFKKILHANDGSESAFHALSLAIALAEQNQSELHMVCVQELPNLPEFIAEVRDAKEAADRRYGAVLRRASEGWSCGRMSWLDTPCAILSNSPPNLRWSCSLSARWGIRNYMKDSSEAARIASPSSRNAPCSSSNSDTERVRARVGLVSQIFMARTLRAQWNIT